MFSFISSHCAIMDPREECIASAELGCNRCMPLPDTPAPVMTALLLTGSSKLYYLSFLLSVMNILHNIVV